MSPENISREPGSLHQRIIADREAGLNQRTIARRQGCAQSTVSDVLAAERLRRLEDGLAALGADDADSDTPKTSVKAVHAAEQVKRTLEYVRAVERRLTALQRLLAQIAADAAADETRADVRGEDPGDGRTGTETTGRTTTPAD